MRRKATLLVLKTIMEGLNKPLETLDLDFVRNNVKAVIFDVDGVVIPTGTFLRENSEGTELTMKTHKMSNEMTRMVNELKKHLHIAFSSGRALLYLQHMLEDVLWDKVSLIAENGNFILFDGKIEQLAVYSESYFQKITNIRNDLKKLQEEKPDSVHGFEPKHLILSIHTAGQMPEIAEIVKRHDNENELYCLWTSEGYDIGRIGTNKKTALQFLSQKLGIAENDIITTGNNLNDTEMLQFGIGVSVDPERVGGRYAIKKKEGELGGEILARYLLEAFGK